MKTITLPSGKIFNLTLNHVLSEFKPIKIVNNKSVIEIETSNKIETLVYDDFTAALKDVKYIINSIKTMFVNKN